MAEKANTGGQITPDEQLELKMAEWSDSVRKNARVFGIAGGVVLLLALGGVFWVKQKEQTEAKAGAALLEAEGAYFGGNYAQSLSQFQIVADRYGSTLSGAQAQLFIGNCQLALGNVTEAESAYRKAEAHAGSDDVFRSAAQRGLATTLLSQGKASEAGKAFAAAAAREHNPLAVDDWISAGRAFAEAGDRPQAIHAFQQVLDLFPDNARAIEARVRMEEIKAAS